MQTRTRGMQTNAVAAPASASVPPGDAAPALDLLRHIEAVNAGMRLTFDAAENCFRSTDYRTGVWRRACGLRPFMEASFGAYAVAPPTRWRKRKSKNATTTTTGGTRAPRVVITCQVGIDVHEAVQARLLVATGTPGPPPPPPPPRFRGQAKNAIVDSVVKLITDDLGLRVVGVEVPLATRTASVATAVDIVAVTQRAPFKLVVIELKVGQERRRLGQRVLHGFGVEGVRNSPRNVAFLQLACMVTLLRETYGLGPDNGCIPMLIVANNDGAASVRLPPWVRAGVPGKALICGGLRLSAHETLALHRVNGCAPPPLSA